MLLHMVGQRVWFHSVHPERRQPLRARLVVPGQLQSVVLIAWQNLRRSGTMTFLPWPLQGLFSIEVGVEGDDPLSTRRSFSQVLCRHTAGQRSPCIRTVHPHRSRSVVKQCN